MIQGVDSVIHAASPLAGRSATPSEALEVSRFLLVFQLLTVSNVSLTLCTTPQVAIEGSLNILKQAEQAGIKRFVLISSLVAADVFAKTDKVTDKGTTHSNSHGISFSC